MQGIQEASISALLNVLYNWGNNKSGNFIQRIMQAYLNLQWATDNEFKDQEDVYHDNLFKLFAGLGSVLESTI